MLGGEARQHVGEAAGCERNDDPDGALGPGGMRHLDRQESQPSTEQRARGRQKACADWKQKSRHQFFSIHALGEARLP
jgi:hypothetical protein